MKGIKKTAGIGVLLLIVGVVALGLFANQVLSARANGVSSYSDKSVKQISVQRIAAAPSSKSSSIVIPPAIQVPAGNVLSAQITGSGVLTYACPATANSVDVPTIVLHNKNGTQTIGTHFAINGELIWEDLMGNSVLAVPQAKAPSPNGSAPWVLLKAQTHTGPGNGLESNVTFIQRVNTMGGVPNAANCMGNNQAEEEIPFSTTYLFYTSAT